MMIFAGAAICAALLHAAFVAFVSKKYIILATIEIYRFV
jgi:hypothetical protein